MKAKLVLALLLMSALGVFAAPMTTTTNFNRRHFLVNPQATPTNVVLLNLDPAQFDTNAVSITLTNVSNSGTNIFNTLIVTNVTYTSNLFATNIYTSNIFVTNLTVSETIVTTNLYVTNIFNTFLVTSNIVAGNINGTTNTIAMFTPDNFSVGNSIVTQNSDTNGITVNGTGSGQIILGGTNNESIVFGSGQTNTLFRYSNNLWYKAYDATPAYPGIGVTNVTETSGALFQSGGNLALLRGTTGVGLFDDLSSGNEVRWAFKYLAPVSATDAILGADERTTLQLWSSSNTKTNFVWGLKGAISTNYSRMANYHTGTNGSIVLDSQASGTAGAARDFLFASNNTTIAKIAANSGYTGAGTLALSDDGTYKAFVSGSDTLWTNISSVLRPKDLTLPVMITNQLSFSSGMTNTLFSSAKDLYYTNNGADTKFIVSNTNGGIAVIEAQGTTAVFESPSANVLLRAGSDQVSLVSGSLYPVVDLNESLGTLVSSWNNTVTSNLFVRGFRSAIVTNYSHMAVNHTGTNGNIMFDSQASGIAGSSRDFLFASNATTVAKIAVNSGYTGLGGRSLMDDGTYLESGLGGFYNFYYTNVLSTNLAAGSTDVITVPNGKRMAIIETFTWTTNTGGTTVSSFFVHSGGNYYRFHSPFNTTEAVPGAGATTFFILEPGDVFSVTNNLAGFYINITGQVFDTNSFLKQVHYLGLDTSTNLLYTTPTGKRARLPSMNFDNGALQLRVSNDSGAACTYKVFVVPPGGSPNSGNMVSSSYSVSNATIASMGFQILPPGYSVYIASSSATAPQAAFLQIFEATDR